MFLKTLEKAMVSNMEYNRSVGVEGYTAQLCLRGCFLPDLIRGLVPCDI